MTNRLMAVSATAAAALFLVATGVEQAAAQRGGRDGGPSGGPSMGSMGRGGGPSVGPSMGRGGGPSVGPGFQGRGGATAPRFDGRGPAAGRFDGRGGPSARPFTRGGSGAYSYAPRYDRRDDDGRRHGRRFRGHRFIFGVAPFYGGLYGYAPCAYYYEQALATGSGYWWDRYYACTGDY
jgi:hypothetical protein